MNFVRWLGVPGHVVRDCIAARDSLSVTHEELAVIRRYATIDSKLVPFSDYFFLSSSERLDREIRRKDKAYRFFAALSEYYSSELPFAVRLYLSSSPCGLQMLQALTYRKSHS